MSSVLAVLFVDTSDRGEKVRLQVLMVMLLCAQESLDLLWTRCTAFAAEPACGSEWTGIKDGLDAAAHKVDLGFITEASIFGLTQIPRPKLKNVRPRTPAEVLVYRLTNVRFVLKKHETDSDYHIVVRDDAGRTMIVESVDPECAAHSYWRTLIRDVRDEIDREKLVEGEDVTVVGPGFLDKLHGQTGVAPNGIELHPILGWCAGADCDPVGLNGHFP